MLFLCHVGAPRFNFCLPHSGASDSKCALGKIFTHGRTKVSRQNVICKDFAAKEPTQKKQPSTARAGNRPKSLLRPTNLDNASRQPYCRYTDSTYTKKMRPRKNFYAWAHKSYAVKCHLPRHRREKAKETSRPARATVLCVACLIIVLRLGASRF